MATEVDVAVGQIVDELKSQGVFDQTLIIFTTDNGNLHGEHGLAEKWFPWEESIRVPLVIRDPRMPKSQRGKVNDHFTLSIDVAPTMLAAARVAIPAFMQGRDISDLYLDTSSRTHQGWRRDFFYEWVQGNAVTAEGHAISSSNLPAVFALIRKDWKYFYWPQYDFEQLFHISDDPREEVDLINSTATTTKEALQLLRSRFTFLKNFSQSGYPV